MKTGKSSLPTDDESESTNSISIQMLNSLKSSEEYRHAVVEEAIRMGLTAQIKAMRENGETPLDYKQFAEKLGKKVSWAYRLEDPNEAAPTIPTLLQVARAFDVALEVRFIPFSKLLGDITSLTPESFKVTGFKDDEFTHLDSQTSRRRRLKDRRSAIGKQSRRKPSVTTQRIPSA